MGFMITLKHGALLPYLIYLKGLQHVAHMPQVVWKAFVCVTWQIGEGMGSTAK